MSSYYRVELGFSVMAKTEWRKSARCAGNGACVEMAPLGSQRGVRDAALGEKSPMLVLTLEAFSDLLSVLKEE
jgi:hypothetical protein